MRASHRPGADLVAAMESQIFNSATVTIGGLYLTTHSIVVTLIGAAAATTLSCWASWLLSRGRNQVVNTRAKDSTQ